MCSAAGMERLCAPIRCRLHGEHGDCHTHLVAEVDGFLHGRPSKVFILQVGMDVQYKECVIRFDHGRWGSAVHHVWRTRRGKRGCGGLTCMPSMSSQLISSTPVSNTFCVYRSTLSHRPARAHLFAYLQASSVSRTVRTGRFVKSEGCSHSHCSCMREVEDQRSSELIRHVIEDTVVPQR